MDPIHATRQLINLALEEDIGSGDLTALAVPAEIQARARLVAKEDCVLSGLELGALVLEVFGAVAEAKIPAGIEDGKFVKAGTTVLTFQGRARDLLTTERTFLNLLQRTCGVATQAHRYKQALQGATLTVLDTRKTTPGLRYW
ncbi:MAG: nicotinate-nucleotide diphosphorylase (carboxylating), partial [Proteobacteria bacterium]